MRAARYYGPGDIRVDDVDALEPGTREVRIDVTACGICGSDLHEYEAGPQTIPDDEPHPVTGERLPVTMGHEFSGTIVDTGPNVSMSTGTRVAVNPIVWCGDCRYCTEGNYHRCTSGGFVGLSGGGGGFSEEVVVSTEKVVPIPDGLPMESAALAEPFSVGLHAVRQSNLSTGVDVAVFGCGPIGLTIVQAARLSGAKSVIAVEPRDSRRERARESGADVLVDPRDVDPVEAIRDICEGGVDVAYEVAGVEQSVKQSIRSTRKGGEVTVVSLFDEEIPIHPNDIVLGERTLSGTLAYLGGPLSDREFRMTLKHFETGAFDPEALVTDTIGLSEIETQGFERLLDPSSDQVKILVRP